DRVGRTRTAGRDDVADAVQLERDRDLTRNHADDRHRDRVWRDAVPPAAEELFVLALGDVDPPRATPDDHASARLVEPKPGVVPGLARGDDGDQRRARVAAWIRPAARLPAIAGPDVDRGGVVDADLGHGRRDLAGERRTVELGDAAGGAAAAADLPPER